MTTLKFGPLTLFDLEPVFVLRFEEGWQANHFRDACLNVLERPVRRVGLVSDVQATRPAEALARKHLTDAISPLVGRFEERIVASIVVSDSTLMRGAMRAVVWLLPQPYPLVPVETMGQAADALAAHFAKEMLAVPASTWSALRALGADRGKGVRAGAR